MKVPLFHLFGGTICLVAFVRVVNLFQGDLKSIIQCQGQTDINLSTSVIESSTKRRSPLLPVAPLVTKGLDFHVLNKYPLALVKCADEGKFPILMQNTSRIIRYVCGYERHVNMAMLYVFSKYAAQGEQGLMLDVGANAGYYGLLAARMGHDIVEFDLQPECLTVLRNSVIVNGYQSHAWVVAAGISETHMNISVPNFGCAGNFPASAHQTGKYGTYQNQMPVYPLGSLIDIEDKRDIMLMKVDTEGNEQRVLRGALPFFRRRKIRNAIVEVTPGHNFWQNEGISVDSVIKTLRQIYSYGYWVACLDMKVRKVFRSFDEIEDYVRKPAQGQMDFWFSIDEDVVNFTTTINENLLAVKDIGDFNVAA